MNFEISLRDIAFFSAGLGLVLLIVQMLPVGRKSGRSRNRRRHRYDDDDDYDQGSSTFLWAALLLLALGGIGINHFSDGKIAKSQKEIEKKTSAPVSEVLQITDDAPSGVIHDEGYVPEGIQSSPNVDDDGLANQATPDESGSSTQYFVQVHVLQNRESVERCCLSYVNRGLQVVTKEKATGTAIYIGPYPSEELARWVNKTQNLKGVIESF